MDSLDDDSDRDAPLSDKVILCTYAGDNWQIT